jgi:glycosyltransferase involved in cell wall biosynthesis
VSGPSKIVLVGNFLPDRQESMLRFERALADGFQARGLALETLRPEPSFVKLGPRYRYGGLPKYLGYLDKFVVFPRRLRRHARSAPAGSVFHIVDHGNAVYAPHLRSVPLLVTVHDLLQIRSARGEFPHNRLGRSGAKYQEWILRNLAGLKAAACVSQKTRSDLQRLTGLADTSLAVVPNSLNYPYRPLPVAEAAPLLARALSRHHARWPAAEAGTAPTFLLGIGGAQWYKNRTGLIAIFAALRRLPGGHARTLVYVGPAFDPEQQALIDQHCLRESILRLPGLENEELRAAYSLAQGLIFPSWEEGFGWPIAEAQACGCPVFTTNRAPMTEVGGDAACYIDPAHPEQAATRIAEALADPAPFRAAGLVQAKRWDPQAMLDAYLHLYTLLLENNNREPFPTAA